MFFCRLLVKAYKLDLEKPWWFKKPSIETQVIDKFFIFKIRMIFFWFLVFLQYFWPKRKRMYFKKCADCGFVYCNINLELFLMYCLYSVWKMRHHNFFGATHLKVMKNDWMVASKKQNFGTKKKIWVKGGWR